jgi:hypothetical protein
MPDLNNDPNPGHGEEPFEKAKFGMPKEKHKPSPEDAARADEPAGEKADLKRAKQDLPPEDVAREEAADDPAADRKAFWALFGVPPPDHSDWHKEELAPPVDRELIRRYYDAELSGAELKYVARMLGFETWERALADLAHQRPPRPPSR